VVSIDAMFYSPATRRGVAPVGAMIALFECGVGPVGITGIHVASVSDPVEAQRWMAGVDLDDLGGVRRVR
jgi:hypothetical protein